MNENDPQPTGTATTQGFVLVGTTAILHTIEVTLLRRLPSTTITGIPKSDVGFIRERVRSAIEAAGFEFPRYRVVVNVTPPIPSAPDPQVVSLDFPIAIAILVASRQLSGSALAGLSYFGELSLSGLVRPTRGALAASLALPAGSSLVVSKASKVAAMGGRVVWGISEFGEVRGLTDSKGVIHPSSLSGRWSPPAKPVYSTEVPPLVVEEFARARAERRPLLLVGHAGHGKTQIARALGALQEEPTRDQAVEILTALDAAGLTTDEPFPMGRPWRAPHHTVSSRGLTGTPGVRPGEASLAHGGILFLDGVDSFARATLDPLLEVYRTGVVRYIFGGQTIACPARFDLVAATEPIFFERAKRALPNAIVLSVIREETGKIVVKRIDSGDAA